MNPSRSGVRFLVIIATLLLSALSGAAHAGRTITLVAENDWFPLTAEREGGIEGMAVDIVRAAYAAVDIQVNFKSEVFIRCMHSVEQGEALGCFNAAKEPDYLTRYLFHKRPLYEVTVGIFAMTASPRPLTEEDMVGRTVGITNGYNYGSFVDIDPRIKRQKTTSDLGNLKMLVAGRVEFSPITTSVAGYLFKTHPESFHQRPLLVGAIGQFPEFVAFSRKRAEAQEAADLLDNGLDLIHKNGTYKKIETEWARRYPVSLGKNYH